MTAGEGGYGFSLVLSLMTRRVGSGCSPGTYGGSPRIEGRSQSEGRTAGLAGYFTALMRRGARPSSKVSGSGFPR